MSKLSVKDRVTAMTRDVLGPEMKVAGFRRSGRVFWRDGSGRLSCYERRNEPLGIERCE
jgi:hypothetical protein